MPAPAHHPAPPSPPPRRRRRAAAAAAVCRSPLLWLAVAACVLAAAPAPTAASALPRSCGATPEAIFIMSTGRTGSTSLLETVNSLPGVEVMGENSAFWSTIVRVDETATSSKRYLSGHMSAFYHTKEGYRRILLGYLNPKAGVTVTGFKETRWSWNIKLKDGDLLVETFPCARMIINYRENVESQLESGFYKNDNPAAKLMPAEHLLSFNKELLAFEARHPANTFRMTTEMMSAENLNKLIAWLGYPHCKVAGAVRANVNSTYSQLPVEGEPFKHVKCGT